MGRPTKHYGKWRIRWRDENNERRSAVFDSCEDAEFKLRQITLKVEEIQRGLRLPDLPDKSFDELCTYWLLRRASRKRSGNHDESIIRCHLLPAFSKMKLRQLGIQKVDDFLATKQHLNPKTIANHLTLLIAMLNMAKDLHWIEVVPRIRKPRIPLFSNDFNYLRTEEETRRLLDAANQEGEMVFVLYAAAIYTGMREGELAGLRWDDVDFEKRLITVQRSFDGPTKANDVRYVPILDPLLPILKAWRFRMPGQLVFQNRDGGMQQRSARVFQEVLRRVLKRANFPLVKRHGKYRGYIVFHDFRHTFASHWVMNEGDIFKLQKILGHKSLAMTMRYAHLAPEAFASEYARLGNQAPTTIATVLKLSNLK